MKEILVSGQPISKLWESLSKTLSVSDLDSTSILREFSICLDGFQLIHTR